MLTTFAHFSLLPEMTDADCWAIFAALNFKPGAGRQPDIEAAHTLLAQRTDEELAHFEDFMSERLHALDTPAHALHFVDDDYLCVDTFLYMRCAAVAAGPEFYARVLADPAQMATLTEEDDVAEDILYLAEQAYMDRHGEGAKWEHLPTADYETYANEAAWAAGSTTD